MKKLFFTLFLAVLAVGLSIALLLCCYCLRQISVLPPLAFWALGLGGKILSCTGAEGDTTAVEDRTGIASVADTESCCAGQMVTIRNNSRNHPCNSC